MGADILHQNSNHRQQPLSSHSSRNRIHFQPSRQTSLLNLQSMNTTFQFNEQTLALLTKEEIVDNNFSEQFDPLFTSFRPENKNIYGKFKVLCSNITNQKIQQYKLLFRNQTDFRTYLVSYFWRKNLREEREWPLVKTANLKIYEESKKILKGGLGAFIANTCSGSKQISCKVFVEDIPLRLCHIKDIPFPQNLYVLKRALKGFQLIYDNIGYIKPFEDLICITRKGVIKVWINSDLSKNFPNIENIDQNITSSKSQSRLVNEILQIINSNTDTEGQPISFLMYLKENHVNLQFITFEKIYEMISQYIMELELQVPDVFASIVEVLNQEEEEYDTYRTDMDQDNGEQASSQQGNNNQNKSSSGLYLDVANSSRIQGRKSNKPNNNNKMGKLSQRRKPQTQSLQEGEKHQRNSVDQSLAGMKSNIMLSQSMPIPNNQKKHGLNDVNGQGIRSHNELLGRREDSSVRQHQFTEEEINFMQLQRQDTGMGLRQINEDEQVKAVSKSGIPLSQQPSPYHHNHFPHQQNNNFNTNRFSPVYQQPPKINSSNELPLQQHQQNEYIRNKKTYSNLWERKGDLLLMDEESMHREDNSNSAMVATKEELEHMMEIDKYLEEQVIQEEFQREKGIQLSRHHIQYDERDEKDENDEENDEEYEGNEEAFLYKQYQQQKQNQYHQQQYHQYKQNDYHHQEQNDYQHQHQHQQNNLYQEYQQHHQQHDQAYPQQSNILLNSDRQVPLPPPLLDKNISSNLSYINNPISSHIKTNNNWNTNNNHYQDHYQNQYQNQNISQNISQNQYQNQNQHQYQNQNQIQHQYPYQNQNQNQHQNQHANGYVNKIEYQNSNQYQNTNPNPNPYSSQKKQSYISSSHNRTLTPNQFESEAYLPDLDERSRSKHGILTNQKANERPNERTGLMQAISVALFQIPQNIQHPHNQQQVHYLPHMPIQHQLSMPNPQISPIIHFQHQSPVIHYQQQPLLPIPSIVHMDSNRISQQSGSLRQSIPSQIFIHPNVNQGQHSVVPINLPQPQSAIVSATSIGHSISHINHANNSLFLMHDTPSPIMIPHRFSSPHSTIHAPPTKVTFTVNSPLMLSSYSNIDSSQRSFPNNLQFSHQNYKIPHLQPHLSVSNYNQQQPSSRPTIHRLASRANTAVSGYANSQGNQVSSRQYYEYYQSSSSMSKPSIVQYSLLRNPEIFKSPHGTMLIAERSQENSLERLPVSDGRIQKSARNSSVRLNSQKQSPRHMLIQSSNNSLPSNNFLPNNNFPQHLQITPIPEQTQGQMFNNSRSVVNNCDDSVNAINHSGVREQRNPNERSLVSRNNNILEYDVLSQGQSYKRSDNGNVNVKGRGGDLDGERRWVSDEKHQRNDDSIGHYQQNDQLSKHQEKVNNVQFFTPANNFIFLSGQQQYSDIQKPQDKLNPHVKINIRPSFQSFHSSENQPYLANSYNYASKGQQGRSYFSTNKKNVQFLGAKSIEGSAEERREQHSNYRFVQSIEENRPRSTYQYDVDGLNAGDFVIDQDNGRPMNPHHFGANRFSGIYTPNSPQFHNISNINASHSPTESQEPLPRMNTLPAKPITGRTMFLNNQNELASQFIDPESQIQSQVDYTYNSYDKWKDRSRVANGPSRFKEQQNGQGEKISKKGNNNMVFNFPQRHGNHKQLVKSSIQGMNILANQQFSRFNTDKKHQEAITGIGGRDSYFEAFVGQQQQPQRNSSFTGFMRLAREYNEEEIDEEIMNDLREV